MVRLSLNDVVHMNSDETWDIHKHNERVEVICDDGILETYSEDFFINSLCWRMFKVLPDEFPSSVKYTISNYEHVSPRTHLDICSSILKDYVMWEESRGIIPNLDAIKKVVYEITSDLDNEIDNRMDSQTTDVCFDHLNEIYFHPPVAEANHRVQTISNVTHDDIQAAHAAIVDAAMKAPELKHNIFAICSRVGVIKLTQLSMMLGPIGYCTNIDSSIIPHAIRTGFFRGMSKLDDLLYESRNASISALFNIIILPLAEYANRRYALPTEYVKNKVVGDCAKIHNVRVPGAKIFVVDRGHLRSLAGLSVIDEDSGKIKHYLSESNVEYIGKYIHVRNPNHCRLKPRNSICTTCIGLLHYSFPDNSVIGHIAGTQVGSITSTAVLQRKHQNLTSQAEDITLDETYHQYLKVNPESRGFMFNKDFKYSDWYLLLDKDSALYINELNSDYGDNLVPSKTTRIEIIKLASKDGLEMIEIPIGHGQRSGYLTKKALEFFSISGWEFIGGDIYQLDLDGWGNSTDIIQLPYVEFTPPDLITAMKEFILSGDNSQSKKTFRSPSLASCYNVNDGYREFYNLVSKHLKGIHSIHLMLIMLAMRAQNPDEFDYRLPYPREGGVTCKLDDVLRYRSMSAAMSYEKQNRLFLDPMTYLKHRRPEHIYDSVLMG